MTDGGRRGQRSVHAMGTVSESESGRQNDEDMHVSKKVEV